MPQRLFRPGFVGSIRLARCSPWAQILFTHLILLADDYGRYDAHPLAVGRSAFPYGDNHGRAFSEEKIAAMLGELETAKLNEADEPCITRYTVAGKQCLILHRWTERLKIQNGKYPGSRYPSPEQDAKVWETLSKDVQSRQILSNLVQSRQILSPTATVPATVPATGTFGEEGGNGIAGRTKFAALRAQVNRLEAVAREDRTEEQQEDLQKKRAALLELQKKQAAAPG